VCARNSIGGLFAGAVCTLLTYAVCGRTTFAVSTLPTCAVCANRFVSPLLASPLPASPLLGSSLPASPLLASPLFSPLLVSPLLASLVGEWDADRFHMLCDVGAVLAKSTPPSIALANVPLTESSGL
jgi:hypothetical protein